jgi:hypothetical protein
MFLITLSCFLKLFIQVVRVVVLVIRVFIAFSISKRSLSLVTLLVLLVFMRLLFLLLVLLIKRVWIRTKRILLELAHLIIFLFLFSISKHIIGNRNLFKFSFSWTTCFVRMVLLCQFVILLFYFFFVSSRRYS